MFRFPDTDLYTSVNHFYAHIFLHDATVAIRLLQNEE